MSDDFTAQYVEAKDNLRKHHWPCARKTELEDVYIKELRMSSDVASTAEVKSLGLKVPKLERSGSKNTVNDYLGTAAESDTSLFKASYSYSDMSRLNG